jgi:hypothetical protein
MSEMLVSEHGTLVRVLVSNLPRVLFEVIAQLIRDQADMLLVGEVQGHLETLLAATQGVDVVILGARKLRPVPGLCTQLLGELPHIKVVALSFSGDDCRVYWLGIRGRNVREMSGASLMSAIRGSRNLT